MANVLAAAEANKKGTMEKYLRAQKAVCEGNQGARTQMVKDVAGTGWILTLLSVTLKAL